MDVEKGLPDAKSVASLNGVTSAAGGGGLSAGLAGAATHTLSKAFLATGMPVTFKNLTYTVANSQKKKEKLTLLNSVSGYLKAGEMAALMGWVCRARGGARPLAC